MFALSYKSKKFFYNIYWNWLMLLWFFKPKHKSKWSKNLGFSIGIVTYINRYETFFKPLILHLVRIFPDTEIIIVINGYYNFVQQTEYLITIRKFLSQFQNVRVIDYLEAQSLSKLWNQIILNSNTSHNLILNDDLRISPRFRKELEKSDFLKEEICLINRSWSHFIISRSVIDKIGWFDERFPGVGNEDEDYESRLVCNHIQVNSIPIHSIKNIVFKTKDFSYGKFTEVVNSKYSKANKVFFDSKWECSSLPKEGFNYVEILKLYVRLRTGMDTPNFYRN